MSKKYKLQIKSFLGWMTFSYYDNKTEAEQALEKKKTYNDGHEWCLIS